MSVSESFLAFVLEQLERVPAVSSRRMFGGVGLYSGDLFFAVIDNDTLFFKVDDASALKYRRRRMPPFQPVPGKPPMTGYYQVPPAVLEDRDEIRSWALEAIGVATAALRARSRARSKQQQGDVV